MKLRSLCTLAVGFVTAVTVLGLGGSYAVARGLLYDATETVPSSLVRIDPADASWQVVGSLGYLAPDHPFIPGGLAYNSSDGLLYCAEASVLSSLIRIDPADASWQVVGSLGYLAPDHPFIPDGLAYVPKSKVVVTHGWVPGGGSIQEFTLMAEEIKERLKEKQHDSQWDVEFHDWTSLANTGTMPWDAVRAAKNGKKEGENLGKAIIEAGYEKVHLVGHSAGAWLIDAAADYIKQHNPEMEVRLTFLDAFATNLIRGLSPSELGDSADWAEQYVDHGWPPFTNWALPNAFNVDVTDWAPDGQSGHGWPVVWYGMTTDKPEDAIAHGWGFLQTLEYSGSRPELSGYARGAVWPPEEAVHFVGAEPWHVGPARCLTPITTSGTGTVVATDAELCLTTGSPVWAEVAVTLTETANFILFGYEFLSEAESQFSVFWQGDLVYEVLRSEADAGVNEDIVWTGADWAPGEYVLRFQLDPLIDAVASVEVSGVRFGVVPEPATLALMAVGGLAALLRLRRSPSS